MNLPISRKILILLLSILILSPACHAGISILGGLSHSKSAQAGESYKGAIIIRNNGDQPCEVKVYQTDYLFYSNGTNIYGKPGEIKRSNAKWIELYPDRLIVPAKGTGDVNYTLKVPDDKSLVGTYWSLIMVEEVKDVPDFSKLKKNQQGLNQVLRYGIQIITSIGDGKSDVKLSNLQLKETKNAKKQINLDIENSGEKQLTLNIWIEIYDKEGKYLGKFEDSRVRLFPGTSTRRTIDLADFPAGEYKGMIIIDAGGDQVFGTSYNFIFK